MSLRVVFKRGLIVEYVVEGGGFVKVGRRPVRAGTEDGKVKPSILNKPSLPLMLKHARSCNVVRQKKFIIHFQSEKIFYPWDRFPPVGGDARRV